MSDRFDPPDAEANIQKNLVKNVLKKVAKHDFSGIGATVEKNTEDDAQKLSQACPCWVSFSDPFGKIEAAKDKHILGRLPKLRFLISGAFGGRSGDTLGIFL